MAGNTFTYRLRSPLGGLAADLTGECGAPVSDEAFSLQVVRGVHLAPPHGTHWRDVAWLAFGMAVHGSDLAVQNPDGLIVRVVSLEYSMAHYRSEVAALAMDGWIRQEFGLPDRGLKISFDAERRRYRFSWGTHAPFADEP